MPVLPPDLERITAAHLDNLVATEAAESLTLEFKAAVYSPDSEGGREFLKDVSALANTAGGWLIIGITEEAGTASEITPIVSPDADNVQQRLESLLQSGIEPRIAGTRIKPVPCKNGYVLVIRVPRSAVPPHRVTARGSNRYYLRSSAGAYEASYNELRNMFIQTAAVSETFSAFRDSRLALIEKGQSSVPLAQEAGTLVVHILPMSAIGMGRPINLTLAHERSTTFRPIGSSGYNPGFNVDGYLNERGGQVCHGYTQVFRDGAIEATKTGMRIAHREQEWVLARRIEHAASEAVSLYVDGLRELEASPPIYVSVSVLGVSGARVAAANIDYMFDLPPTLRISTLRLPICVIEDFGDRADHLAALRPALDALWNAGGMSEWQPET